MNAQAELVQALAAAVGEIAASAHRLHTLLEEESAALDRADEARLLELTGSKTALLQQLERLEYERAHLVGQLHAGARNAPFAMERALSAYPAALGTWEDAVTVLGRCRTLNERNGTAVELRLRQVRQALTLLTGASPGAGLYGRQGVPESLGRSTSLARA
jgi:flagella synthesis protein FlgN